MRLDVLLIFASTVCILLYIYKSEDILMMHEAGTIFVCYAIVQAVVVHSPMDPLHGRPTCVEERPA